MQNIPSDRILALPPTPNLPAASHAHEVLRYARLSCEHLLNIFNSLAQARGPGAPRNEEVDLLRAMIVFAGAGLDSATKHLIRECLPELLRSIPEDGVPSATEKTAGRLLRMPGQDSGGLVDTQRLAKLLLSGDPKSELIELIVADLVGSSLQSVDQLEKAAAHFGLKLADIKVERNSLREAFSWRNQITHEMDIDFSSSRKRNRRSRPRAGSIEKSNTLLLAGFALVKGVDETI